MIFLLSIATLCQSTLSQGDDDGGGGDDGHVGDGDDLFSITMNI